MTELVANGLTNREVATRLFLSPHTVDSHLRHIFRKLDINSRVDLVRLVIARSVANRAPAGAADVAYVHPSLEGWMRGGRSSIAAREIENGNQKGPYSAALQR